MAMHDKINKEREAIRQDNAKNIDKPKRSNANGDKTGKTRQRRMQSHEKRTKGRRKDSTKTNQN